MSVRFQGRLDSRLFLPLAVFTSAVFAQVGTAQSLPPESDAAPPEPVIQMHLMTASSGWVWKGSRVLWTSTAGQIWVDITPPLTATQRVGSVSFLDAEHGWALLQPVDAPATLATAVAATKDEGKSWSVASVPDDAPLQYTGGVFNFVDERNGWLWLGIQGSSAFSKSKLFRTGDGGATWSLLSWPPINGSTLFFADGTGWLCGGVNRDQLYRTRDGGLTWLEKIIALPEDVQRYTMPDASPSGTARPAHSRARFTFGCIRTRLRNLQ